ncbi:hypothetical protein INR49_019572, partial [Caranx melampygus]
MASGSPSSSPDTATGSGTDPARPDTGEPLGGAGSDSDSDLGLGKFDCSAMEMGDRLEGEELEREFESAADRVRDLIQTASRDQLLYLYARYKQVKVGKCNTPKPGFFDFEGQRKWQAWKQLGDMEAEQAMQEYISCVNVLDPEGRTKERQGAERRTGFEDKNIFDYCRENNIDHVNKAISSQKVDVNTKDEEGRALLHWACDRGHKELVSVLLQHKADINSQIDDRIPPQGIEGDGEGAEEEGWGGFVANGVRGGRPVEETEYYRNWTSAAGYVSEERSEGENRGKG